jgi:hypothetical protein
VLPPQESSLPEAAAWARSMLTDEQAAQTVGKSARVLAEREFALDGCASRFEAILEGSRR